MKTINRPDHWMGFIIQVHTAKFNCDCHKRIGALFQFVHNLSPTRICPSKSIVNMYSMGACSALGINNQEALSEDLENDPFLNSALQRFTCELYYRFGLFLAPLTLFRPGFFYCLKVQISKNYLKSSESYRQKPLGGP